MKDKNLSKRAWRFRNKWPLVQYFIFDRFLFTAICDSDLREIDAEQLL